MYNPNIFTLLLNNRFYFFFHISSELFHLFLLFLPACSLYFNFTWTFQCNSLSFFSSSLLASYLFFPLRLLFLFFQYYYKIYFAHEIIDIYAAGDPILKLTSVSVNFQVFRHKSAFFFFTHLHYYNGVKWINKCAIFTD